MCARATTRERERESERASERERDRGAGGPTTRTDTLGSAESRFASTCGERSRSARARETPQKRRGTDSARIRPCRRRPGRSLSLSLHKVFPLSLSLSLSRGLAHTPSRINGARRSARDDVVPLLLARAAQRSRSGRDNLSHLRRNHKARCGPGFPYLLSEPKRDTTGCRRERTVFREKHTHGAPTLARRARATSPTLVGARDEEVDFSTKRKGARRPRRVIRGGSAPDAEFPKNIAVRFGARWVRSPGVRKVRRCSFETV